MPSIKAKFRPSSGNDHLGTIYYQIIHERKTRYLRTSYRLSADEWDAQHSAVVTGSDERSATIRSVRESIHHDIERLAMICRKLSDIGIPYSADDIISEFHVYSRCYSLFNYMNNRITDLSDAGRHGTADNYRYTLHSFKRFRKDEDIMLDCLTAGTMQAYEAWLMSRGISLNSISFYLRILRAVYNHAVDREIIEDRHPFKKVYTGIGKTVKRALPLGEIKKIKDIDLTDRPDLSFARDMFMMSFYLRGMSFVDMCYLRKSDLRNGYLTYSRRKTGTRLTIAWEKEMQAILDRHTDTGSDYLLPIIRTGSTNERGLYRNAGHTINRRLKQIGKLIGIAFPLTLYMARHSWASGAKAIGIPVSVISEGMGHDSESTTRIYLASLDNSVVDNANSRLIKCL